MDSALAMDGRICARRPRRGALTLHALALAAILSGAAVTAAGDHWAALPLALIAAFSVLSDLTTVLSASSHFKVSGTVMGIVLAAVLFGGAPAALVGVIAICIGWLRSREAPHYFANNVVNYAGYPLVAGLCFHAAVRAAGLSPAEPGYYLLVFLAFVLALTLNFLVAAGYQSYLDGSSLTEKAREALLPLLSADLFSGLLACASAFVAVKLGTVGIALVSLALAIFQYLVGELLRSSRRAEELRRLASTDELTGLPNRDRFRERLSARIEAAVATQTSFAVMLIDLDRFKEINDTLGHHYGDELLRQLGPRLTACVGDEGLVARLGGDEFGVLPGIDASDPPALERLAAQLAGRVQDAFMVDELALEVGASIGIARFPEDGTDAHALLRRVDVAMYAAKEAHTGHKHYAPELDHHSVGQLGMLSDFRRALQTDEIVVYYQPIVDLADASVRGAEALVRWNHPERGLLAPGAFIDAVERTGLIGPLTSHVLERSVAQCAAWRRAGKQLTVAVNLSVRNLLDPELPAQIDRLLAAHALPPEALQLEITESMLMSDPERVLATVVRLNSLGVRLSVDDFGTGYSSLANLRQLPIDELKIDRSFVSPMLQDESDLIIVRSTINLGHDLGLRVIAEGVEDESTMRRLARLGCDLAQGYHVSRPMPAGQFDRWLDEADTTPELALAG